MRRIVPVLNALLAARREPPAIGSLSLPESDPVDRSARKE